MRILLVNTLYAPYRIGGAEKSVQYLAESLVRKNHEVAVITLGKENETTRLNGVSIYRLKLKNIYWPFDSNPTTAQKIKWHLKDTHNKDYDEEIMGIIKEFQPDIIHTHNLGGFSVRIWKLARQNKTPILHTLRDYYLMSVSTTHLTGEKKSDFFFSRKRKKLSQKVDAVSGISRFILDEHLKNGYFKNSKTHIIYNGFDFNDEKPKLKKSNDVVFGFMGQIKEHKGINMLLDVFSRLNQSNVRLKIAGNAPEDLINQYKSNPKIEFTGYVKPDDFMRQIDVLAVPSLWHEPFGRVVMEAMTKNTPVIGSNMGGIPELLENNKDFIFEPDEDSLFGLMSRIASHPEILNEFKFDSEFLQEFSLDSMTKKYESAYNSLILHPNEN